MPVPEINSSDFHPGGLGRRAFLQAMGLAAPAGMQAGARGEGVIDCHAHLHHRSRPSWEKADRALIDAADKLGIDHLCCSILTPRRPSSPEEFRECNQWVADGMLRFAGRVHGYCYVNPGHTREALDEIRRCVEDRGFVGIKLYNEHRVTEPVVWPVIELAIRLRVPILHHAGHMHYVPKDQPNISDGGHLAEVARRYPEAMLICAHVGGGGDWEWTIKALRHASNVYLDTSGSVTDDGMIEMAVSVLGADRILFGCDNSMTAGMGKMRGAALSARVKKQIMVENMRRIMAKRGNR